MKIDKALTKRSIGNTISSEIAKMYCQNPESLLYWILENPKVLDQILEVEDWEIDHFED